MAKTVEKSEIKPIWKRKGNKADPKYYRPVALLPAISRLVERILAEQLKNHIRDHGILPKSQHGFRPKHSPESAIVELIDEIASRRDERNTVVVASADLAGAFDTLDHHRLIAKLQRRGGLRGSALALLEDYLKNRTQRTKKSDGSTSRWAENAWGVPQGSVMGPLLFALFCEDIGEWITDAKVV